MGEDEKETRTGGRQRWHRIGRRLGPSAALIIAVLLMLGLVSWDAATLIVPAASPLVAICSTIARRAVSWIALLAIPTLAMALVRRRWFCRYACPVGLLTEQAGRPMIWTRRACRRVPPLGRWIAMLAIGGACVGYPVLLWLDPLAIFAGFFDGWQRPWSLTAFAPALGLPIVLVFSFFLPGVWCLRLCPLGGLQELLAWHKGTEPVSHEQTPLDSASLEKGGLSGRLSRRALVALGLGAGWGAMSLQVLRKRKDIPLRPPGAVEESRFSGLCVRCGNCVRTCPAAILRADTGQHGLASLFTPVVRFVEDYCREGCHRCTQVCPSGAIEPLTLEAKRQAKMGLAKVDMSVCLLGDDHECQVCRNHCPYEAITTVWSDETYTRVLVIDQAKCVGCGACEVACVTMPAKAIRVVSMPRSACKPQ